VIEPMVKADRCSAGLMCGIEQLGQNTPVERAGSKSFVGSRISKDDRERGASRDRRTMAQPDIIGRPIQRREGRGSDAPQQLGYDGRDQSDRQGLQGD